MRSLIRIALFCLLFFCAAAFGQLATGVNYNNTAPAPPNGQRNVIWQNDGGRPTVNASAYVIYPTKQVQCPGGSDLSTAVNSCLAALPTTTGGVCDARACMNNYSWNNTTTITTSNSGILLPCGTITATQSILVSPGVRNTTVHGCAYQGGSPSSGTVGGTVWNYQGNGTAFLVGDTTYTTDTPGFYMTDMSITTPSAGSSAYAMQFHRVQEIDLERLYLIGDNSTGQTAIYLSGTGNYSGGSFVSLHIASFGTGITFNGDGTGGANASTFVRLHLNCSSSAGSPISGTIGLNMIYADGNTFSGGDIEACDTMLSLGAGAVYNTFNGVRNENSNNQVIAASGSKYNLWLAGGTMFTGKLTDAGLHNSWVDTFHRAWNNLNGDLWRSQADATVTNHVYTGIGLGNVRGRQDEWQTDVPGTPNAFQNAWLWGPGDGTSGQQVWMLQDVINNVIRFGVQQNTTAGGNNQTYLNAAGTGSVCINCGTNSGTGGFSVASGGSTPATVFSVSGSGAVSAFGELDFFSGTTEAWQFECASTSTCIIRNPNATVPADILIATTNGGTEIDSQGTAAVTINNHSFAGTGGFIVYEGGSNASVAAFTVSGGGSFSVPGNGQIGNASGTGNLAVGNHINQLGAGDFGGTCAMSSSTSCNVSLQHSFATPICFCEDQGSNTHHCAAAYASGHITVTADTSNSDTWAAFCFGNPT